MTILINRVKSIWCSNRYHDIVPPDKASLEDKLLIALSYWREYRTYAHIGVSYGYSESQVCRLVRWFEDILIASGSFTVGGKKELLTIDKEKSQLLT